MGCERGIPPGPCLTRAGGAGRLPLRVSPLTYVRKGLPPVFTVHGDADPTVPYQHAVRLHEALNKADVPNELLTIPGGKHGNFTREETLRAHEKIEQFLARQGLGRVK